MRPRRTLKPLLGGCLLALAASGLTGCSGGGAGGTDTLTWFINPDGGGSSPTGGGQAQLAAECSQASGGAYTIRVELLPNEASDQRQQLIRRLAAHDSGVDIMSLDPVVVPEFAEAGYLVDVPEQYTADFTQDRVQGSLDASQWDGRLVAAPFWSNTQLLWYRKSVAAAAGLDMTQPVTFDRLIEAAQATGTDIAVQAKRYEGYTVFVNALVAGAGGSIVQNEGASAEDTQLGLDSPQGQRAAEIIRELASSGAVGPALSSMNETTSLNMFQDEATSGFMLNWMYVYAAMKENNLSFLDDIGWTTYPRVDADKEAAPPFGGIELGVNTASRNKDESWQAISCITSAEHQKAYMIGTGNAASRSSVFDDPQIQEQFPMADVFRESLNNAVQRPRTAYYGDLSTAIQRTWSPPEQVDPATTPAESTELIMKVLRGEALL
ncbi:extracellular solute-binding protein [uncultured Propionibacterium sp.]|uniref:extracellular solute-binding protein n=1 Tax=uncultured Propionibacterium sp. TaxID=218066 RepID=UPI0029317AAF|nr:extracellular solute-binding protein [uncultured Propionibacterium sp.]